METTATSPQHTKILKHAAMQQNFRRLRVQPAISGEKPIYGEMSSPEGSIGSGYRAGHTDDKSWDHTYGGSNFAWLWLLKMIESWFEDDVVEVQDDNQEEETSSSSGENVTGESTGLKEVPVVISEDDSITFVDGKTNRILRKELNPSAGDTVGTTLIDKDDKRTQYVIKPHN